MQSAHALAPARQAIWTRDYVLVWFCRFFMFFSLYLLVPTMPLYLTDLGLSSAQVGLTMAAFFVTAIVLRPLSGYYIDTIGARAVTLLSLVLFTLGPLGYLLSTLPLIILAVRFFHGAGFSCMSAVNTLAANLAPKERRGEALGMFIVSSNVASAAAAAIGVWLYRGSGPQVLFLAASLCGGLSWSAARLLSPGGAEAPARRPDSFRQYMRTFFTPETLSLCVPLFAVTFVTGGINTFLPLQAVANGLPNPGLYFTVYAVTLIVVRPLTGRLSDRFSRAAVAVPAFVPIVVAMLLLAWLPATWVFFPAAVLHAAGYGTLEAVLMASIVDRVAPERRGGAMSQWGIFYDLGVGGGGITLGIVLQLTNQSYPWMYGFIIALLTAGVGYYLHIQRRLARQSQ